MSTIYLARPIDQTGGNSLVNETVTWSARLAAAGFGVFRPSLAHVLPEQANRGQLLAVDQMNAAALAACSGLVALLPDQMATLGTPVEIDRMLLRGKPVLIVAGARAMRSVQVRAWEAAGAKLRPFDGPIPRPEVLRELLAPAQKPGIPWAALDEAATPPTRAYPDDAGLDLAASRAVEVEPGGRAMVPTSLAFALPTGMFGLILGRSSTWHKRNLMVIPAVIDAGWRGELFASVYNPGSEPVKIEAGERVAQYVLLPAWMGNLREVGPLELPPHERGTNGFGSSGK